MGRSGGGARQPVQDAKNPAKIGQEREIFGLARAPEWAHHFCQDLRLMLQRRL
jgi:hypothetical protein